jgi:hypothetical protein
MTAPHDDRRREPRLPPELAFVAERLGRGIAPPPPGHLRGKVLGAVIDALGTDGLAKADLLPPSRREPWPAALLLLSGLLLAMLVSPWLARPGERPVAPLTPFAERVAALGIPLPDSVTRHGSATAPAAGDAAARPRPGRFAATSIAALRSLPQEH